MPIYAYRCAACGHTKDVLQKLSDPVLSACPSCGAESFQKQLTAAGFQLKGSGWYATDFKGGASSTTAKPAETKTDSSTAAQSDSSAPAAAGSCGSSCACH
jgi:putative FmdB family regulatory protein